MVDSSLNKIGIRLNPLDVLAFRDGRPFDAGSFAKSGLPMPQALAGCLRTALLRKYDCDFKRLASSLLSGARFSEALVEADAPPWIAGVIFRGPWLAKMSNKTMVVYVTSPANVHQEKNKEQFYTMQPVSSEDTIPGWQPPEGEPMMRPLWLKSDAKTEQFKGLISSNGLEQFLDGAPITPKELIPADKPKSLYHFDQRVGIGISPQGLHAEESLIYSISFLALNPEAFFYAEALLPADARDDVFAKIETLPFGGEGRHVLFEQIEPFFWPEKVPSKANEKIMLLLITPSFFDAGWKGKAFNGNLAGAAVPGYTPVSGWDLAKKGPKPTRFAAPSGSIYFLNQSNTTFPESLSDSVEDWTTGYGAFLKGVWTDE